MIPVHALPSLNAGLNLTSAAFLCAGFWFIRKGNVSAHRACMAAALAASSLFLVSYLYYHAQVGSIPFQGTGWIRTVYFTILISHSLLAAVIVPLVLRTIYLAWRQRWGAHRALARWTFPVWLYVSVTGVVIYLFLYGV